VSNSSAEYAPPRSSSRAGRPYVIAGFICAAVAIVFLPIVLGPVAVVLGFLAHRKGDRLGRWVMAAGVVGMVLGFALGALVFAEAQRQGALALVQSVLVR